MRDPLSLTIDACVAAIEDAGGTAVEGGLFSNERSLADGTEDTSARRVTDHPIALFEFKDGSGVRARDTSGTEPAMDLNVEGPAWLSSYGLDIESGKAWAPVATSRKLYDRIGQVSPFIKYGRPL